MKFEAISAPTINELFETKLQDMILSGELAVGEKLPTEQELADGTLFELRFNKMIPKRHFSVVTADREQPSAAAKRMLELIRTKDLPERNGNDSYDYF